MEKISNLSDIKDILQRLREVQEQILEVNEKIKTQIEGINNNNVKEEKQL